MDREDLELGVLRQIVTHCGSAVVAYGEAAGRAEGSVSWVSSRLKATGCSASIRASIPAFFSAVR